MFLSAWLKSNIKIITVKKLLTNEFVNNFFAMVLSYEGQYREKCRLIKEFR